MSAPREPRVMPRDVAPEFWQRSWLSLPSDEPAQISRDPADERARWAVEHDPRRLLHDRTARRLKSTPTA